MVNSEVFLNIWFKVTTSLVCRYSIKIYVQNMRREIRNICETGKNPMKILYLLEV